MVVIDPGCIAVSDGDAAVIPTQAPRSRYEPLENTSE
jgi:hypothetical protein